MQQNEKSLPKGTEQPLSDEMDEELLDYDYDYEPSQSKRKLKWSYMRKSWKNRKPNSRELRWNL